MKWNADKELLRLERVLGGNPQDTRVDRVWLSIADMTLHGVTLPADKPQELGSSSRVTRTQCLVWKVSFGPLDFPTFGFGWTIHEAYLKARRAAKSMKGRRRLTKKLNRFKRSEKKSKKS